MWVWAILPSLVVLGLIAGGVALLVRGRGQDGWNIQFSGVLLGYVAIAMLVGVFLVASGSALLLKAGFAEAGDRDFSYDTQRYPVYEPPAPFKRFEPGDREPVVTRTVDPSDNQIRDDIATGISLAFAGSVLFAVHAFGAVLLRRRDAQGQPLVARAYNLVGLATATLGFLAAGGQALNDIVRRYVVGGEVVEPWQVRHPGEPLAFAAVLLPLILWFGWRLWQEMSGRATREHVNDGASATLEPRTA